MLNNQKITQIYSELELGQHIEFITNNNKNHINIYEITHPISELSKAEFFVDEVRFSKNLAFDENKLKENQLEIENNKLAKHYQYINGCFDAYSKEYSYSPKVTVLYDACKELHINPECSRLDRPLDMCLSDGKTTYAHLFNALIKKIREHCDTNKFKLRLKHHNRTILRRKAKAMLWERKLFDWRSRHLILSLTLLYKEQLRTKITLNTVQNHLKNLLNNRRSNALLNGIEAYVWKIEEGDMTGLHVHMLIVYRPNASHDVYIADKIGQYWESVITDGMGQYWNSNRSKARLEQLGHGTYVGQINHYDTDMREALRKNLEYLMKSDQYVKQKNCSKTRILAMSHVPERSAAGRPRIRAELTQNIQ